MATADHGVVAGTYLRDIYDNECLRVAFSGQTPKLLTGHYRYGEFMSKTRPTTYARWLDTDEDIYDWLTASYIASTNPLPADVWWHRGDSEGWLTPSSFDVLSLFSTLGQRRTLMKMTLDSSSSSDSETPNYDGVKRSGVTTRDPQTSCRHAPQKGPSEPPLLDLEAIGHIRLQSGIHQGYPQPSPAPSTTLWDAPMDSTMIRDSVRGICTGSRSSTIGTDLDNYKHVSDDL